VSTLWHLFVTFFKIGIFGFGGGYAMIPLIQTEIIQKANWISLPEFLDIVAIAEATPGPIAVNAATFIGYKIGGVFGSAVATFGVVLPSITIVLGLSIILSKNGHTEEIQEILECLKPIVLALVCAAAFRVASVSLVNIGSIFVAALAFAAVRITNLHPIAIIILSAVVGILFSAVGFL
jgi:chromate transporter